MTHLAYKPLILLIIFFTISACSSLPDQENLNKRADDIAEKSSQTAQALLQQAKLRLHKADSELLAFYAPTYLQEAKVAYDEAREKYLKKQSASKIKSAAQLSIEWVNAGLRNKKMVNEYLTQSLSHRQVLLDLHANDTFPDQFTAIDHQFIELIRLIEQRQEVAAQKQEANLIQSMWELEVTTVNHQHLSQSIIMIAQAQALKAQKQLPATYKKLLAQINDTQEFIRLKPRETSEIEDRAHKTLFMAERLYSLARVAQQMKLAQDAELESLVLKHEQQIQRIADALHHTDIRNLSFEDQSILISQYGKKVIHQTQRPAEPISNNEELDKWKRKVVLLEAEVRRLQRKQALN